VATLVFADHTGLGPVLEEGEFVGPGLWIPREETRLLSHGLEALQYMRAASLIPSSWACCLHRRSWGYDQIVGALSNLGYATCYLL
jgi:hypothetical protein